MPGQDLQSSARFSAVDALRGAAALGVFVFHVALKVDFPRRTLPAFGAFRHTFTDIPSITSAGASGVSLFFVISGFCLMWQQHRLIRAGDDVRLSTYVWHRISRIVPPYWAAILLSAAVAVWKGDAASAVWRSAIVHGAFLQGFVRREFLSLNDAMWSMVTEVQFYVVFPLVARWQRRWGWPRVLAGAALVTIAWRTAVLAWVPPELTVAAPVSGRVLLLAQVPARLVEFALGMALAEVVVSRPAAILRRPLLALIVIGAPAALLARMVDFAIVTEPLTGLLYAAVVGWLVLAVADDPPGRAVRLLRGAVASSAGFGRISYSFFLVHVPVLTLAAQMIALPESHPYRSFARLVAVGFPLSLVTALVLYHAVERPALTLARRSPAERRRA